MQVIAPWTVVDSYSAHLIMRSINSSQSCPTCKGSISISALLEKWMVVSAQHLSTHGLCSQFKHNFHKDPCKTHYSLYLTYSCDVWSAAREHELYKTSRVSLHLLGTEAVGWKHWIMCVWFVLCQGHPWLTASARILVSIISNVPSSLQMSFVLPLKVLMSATSYMERKWVKGPHYFRWGLTEPNKEHKTDQLSQTIALRHLKQGWELNCSPLLSELSPAPLHFPCLLVSARQTRHWQRSISSAVEFWLVVPISTGQCCFQRSRRYQEKNNWRKSAFSSLMMLQNGKSRSTAR